ncbi:hypothetical protein N9N28_05015 [Rubripirellula amarantea]|nr:hypothetical protein [Rubripirellula amarantea]
MIETAAYLDAIYGKCDHDDGEIIFVDSTKRETVLACRVGDGKALVSAAQAIDGRVGHYLKVNLMDADAMRERGKREDKDRFIVGNAGEVKTIVSLHLDCDAGKSSKYHSRKEMLRLLDQMPHKPTLVINSDGDDGGFHAYWILDRPHRIVDELDRERVQGIANRWQSHLNNLADGKLDSTADISRLLRIVGQCRRNGNVVACHHYDPSAIYSLADLTLPIEAAEVVREARREMHRRIVEAIGSPPKSSGIESRASAYVARMEPSISGSEGHKKCFLAALTLIKGFGLGEVEARQILIDTFNPQCNPPWSEKEIDYKIKEAMKADGEVGYLITRKVTA